MARQRTSIKKLVQNSFDDTSNIRISHTIEEKGASHLLSGVYTQEDADTRRFYRKPKLAEGEETKLAILYGETLITPYIIDVGVSNGVNDPANITRTIRFIAGDGETEGVVVGPGGSQMQNVYVGGGTEVMQPVINSDGRPTTKDIVLGSLLGGAITSIPKIWDAIKTNSDEKIATIDPVTGAPIQTKQEKELAETIGSNINVEGLSDVRPVEEKGKDWVLAYDNCTKLWVPKPISDLLGDTLEITGGTAATGGTGGTGAVPAIPAIPPTDEQTVTTTPPDAELPDTELSQDSTVAETSTVADMIELKDISVLEDNEYKQEVEVLGTNGIQIHLHYDGLGQDKTWDPVNASDSGSDLPCLTNPNTPSNPGNFSYAEPGTCQVDICLSMEICGYDYSFYMGSHTITGESDVEFTQHTEIKWSDTQLEALLSQFPGQIINSSNNTITMRLQRTDGLTTTGTVQSKYPVHFQGIKFIFGDEWEKLSAGNQGETYAAVDAEKIIDDDGAYPDEGPSGGAVGPYSCPGAPVTVVYPATPGFAGQDAVPAVPPTDGTDSTPGDVTPTTPAPTPILELNTPLGAEYCEDEDGDNFPEFYDLSTIPTIKTASSETGSGTVEVNYKIVQGDAIFVLIGSLPGGVTPTLSEGDRALKLVGTDTDFPAASAMINIQAADSASGDILYQIDIANDEGGCAGNILTVKPCSTAIEESKGACAYLTLTATSVSTGSTEVYMTMPSATSSAGTAKKQLTSSAVPKTTGQTVDAHTAAVVANMTANIATKNALPIEDANWLPDLDVTASAAKITVCAPAASGDAFNDFQLSTELTGGVGLDLLNSLPGLFGGATKTVPDVVADNPTWSAAKDILLGIAGNVAGAVVSNIIFNNASTLDISIPEGDAEVDVAFLYRGRKVKMPVAYDQATRSGTPDFDAWGGDWAGDVQTKKEWSDNPAWCLMDYIENKKFGLGEDLVLTPEQKNTLVRDIFDIAAYCDEVVEGGLPRFSLNTAITDGTKIQILEQLCSVFFGAFVFYKGGLRITADQPDNTVKLLVNQASCSDIVYEHTTLKSFINKVEVTYVEPDNFFVEASVTAENTVGIAKYGEKVATVFGFGITNSDQALRYANWILNSEIENSLLVSYTAGWDHYKLVPGEIIQLEDSNERGARLAGRVASVVGTSVTVDDGSTVAVVGDGFSVTMEDGTVHETTITAVLDSTHYNISVAPPQTVWPNSTFIISDQSVGPQYFKVISVDEVANGVFNTTVQLYNYDKYNSIVAETRS